MPAVLELVFVLSPQANLFWAEIAEATCDELEAIGIRARISTEGFPQPKPGRVYVLSPPHEYFALEVLRPGNPPPPPEVLKRTIFICGEQPGTSHFDENVALAPQAGAVFDINRGAIREFARRGVTALPFQLGYTAKWDHRTEQDERDIDVLFLGSHSPRRDLCLAEFGETLWRWHCRLVFGDNSGPNSAASARYLADDEKWRALTRSKVLLNVHQGTVPYFEWARVVQTMANGCVLVTEHSTDFAPLEPGEHFLCAALQNVALLAELLLGDEEARRTMATSAYDFLRRELPLRAAAEKLASVAEDVDRHPVAERAGGLLRPWRKAAPFPLGDLIDNHHDLSSLRRVVSGLLSEVRGLERDLERSTSVKHRSLPSPVEIAGTSRAYGTRSPRVWAVTVVVSNREERVEATLDSVIKGRYRDIGLIVVADGLTDDSLASLRRWMNDHHAFPLLVVRHAFRRGVARSLNAALAFSDGDFTLVLPAGSTLFPHALGRLVAALDWDAGADFAYGIDQRRGPGGAVRLGNVYPWEPARLRVGRYIDEIALIRTDVLREAGGFTTDARLDGWHAHDFWCGIAERGHHAAFVPEILARRRDSQLTTPADLSPEDAYEALSERHPGLMAGVAFPP